ncbi:hypothetical protein MNKW57_13640 [Biformimicrobium ophioploci]|uniref:Methyltransferase domain-containing protein n=1 Tax=Biformimicrobium ophioploci TaxID=3036711 RepID=A0ABQ6LY74_9GAMM|nr:hypothetical protein MNKW57_13640 [Microbulbifer sp. NKW57]
MEWCGGKGHLGRYLHACYGSRVDTLEIDSTLVREGEELARKLDYPQSLHECDVLAEPSAVWLKPETHLLGLHACGGLHVTMLEKGVDAGTCRISLSPCCYHLYGPEQYQPMSGSGRVTGLHLTREELRNAVRQTETAPARQRRQRAQMQSWRLGFDALQQQITGTGQYMPVPSLPTRLLKGSFEAFCRHCAELKGLSLAENLDFFRFEREGLALFRQRSREDLVRMLFRRPLEVWLALDRVLFLEENGYQCRLLQFCPPALTPRNLLLDAHR